MDSSRSADSLTTRESVGLTGSLMLCTVECAEIISCSLCISTETTDNGCKTSDARAPFERPNCAPHRLTLCHSRFSCASPPPRCCDRNKWHRHGVTGYTYRRPRSSPRLVTSHCLCRASHCPNCPIISRIVVQTRPSTSPMMKPPDTRLSNCSVHLPTALDSADSATSKPCVKSRTPPPPLTTSKITTKLTTLLIYSPSLTTYLLP